MQNVLQSGFKYLAIVFFLKKAGYLQFVFVFSLYFAGVILFFSFCCYLFLFLNMLFLYYASFLL